MSSGMIAYIGIGSNISDPVHQCKESIRRLSCVDGLHLERTSSLYRTEPVVIEGVDRKEIREQDWCINAVAEIRAMLSARDLFNVLKNIEQEMGRKREFKGSPRTIDLDLLLYGQEVVNEEDLIIPHPEMHKRRFVLEPMCEIASYVIHPAFGVSMRGLKERLADKKIVERLGE